MKSFRKQLSHEDRGVALVMAMGVALIGISVAAIVITLVIVAANDSGRDRLRTTEVHSAEGAVDATMAELEMAAPCPGPSFNPLGSPLRYGSGSQATDVTVVIDYYNDSSPDPLPCDDGKLEGVPNRAVVTATSVGVQEVQGIQPERNVQIEVGLTPNESNGVTAAIFAANSFGYNANLQVVPAAGGSADVWLDKGNWLCTGASGGKGGVVIDGSLYVPDGTLEIRKGCDIHGDVWVRNGLTLASDTVIGGSVTVYSGNVTHSGFTVGSNVLVGGDEVGSGDIVAPGTVEFNANQATIPYYTPGGLPKIEYPTADSILNDWTGFVEKDLEDFNGGDCGVNGTVTLGGSAASPEKQLYDLRGCDPLDLKSKADLQICEDTALFVSGVKSSSPYKVGSCDGEKHQFWMIVPYTPNTGNMDLNKGSVEFDGNITSFWYAPAGLTMQTHSTFYGKIFGGTLDLKNDGNYNFVDVGVPGVDLAQGTAAQFSGFRVELLSKREVS